MTEIKNAHFTTLKGAYDVDTMDATLRIRRYDPDTQRSRFDTFTVTIPVTASVLDALDAVLELRGVAAELLSERDRSGVLQVRATGLDDVGEGLALGFKHRRELSQRWNELLLDRLVRRDVDR